MTRDELEFSISQYLDGTLAEAERDTLETRLGSDADARALFAEYESLQRVLETAPVPAVQWNRFAEQIWAAVSREEMPAQSYKLSHWLRPARLAVAASVLAAAGIGFGLLTRDDRTPVVVEPSPVVEPTRIALIDPAPALGEATAIPNNEPFMIAIGPAAVGDDESVVRRYADSVVARRSKAVIVSAAPVGQDSVQMPF